jgi:sugar phosphate isomerase/epimerase
MSSMTADVPGDMPSLSISQSIMRGRDIVDDLDRLIEAGGKMTALMGASLRPVGPETAARLMKERGLRSSSYHAGLRILELDDAAANQAIRTAILDGAAVGAPVVAVSAGRAGERKSTEADQVYVERLRRAAPLARELGVRLGIEPLHPLLCELGYIHNLRHGAEVASRVEGCCIVLDTAQLFWDRELYTDIERHVGYIGLIQLGQLSRPDLAEKRWVRAPFYDGAVPMEDIIRALHAAGYRGAYEHENLLPGEMSRAARIASIKADAQWFRELW